MSDTLFDALANSERERAAGNLNAAQQWLERADRIAPNNAVVRLHLAGILLAQGDPRARTLYDEVAQGTDVREAWLGLAAAALRLGDPPQAAAALARVLSQHAHAADDIATVAGAVADAAGASGWCALDGAGMLAVSLRGHAPTADLDGRPLPLRRHAGSGLHKGRLPQGWAPGQAVRVLGPAGPLLGSPIAIARIARVEGFADSTDGDLHGWAWCPNDADRAPLLSVVPQDGGPAISVVADDEEVRVGSSRPFARPRGFHIPAARLRHLTGPVRVLGRDGRNLTGSPLDPSAERVSAERAAASVAHMFPAPGQDAAPPPGLIPLPAVPAHLAGGPPAGGATKRPVDIVVPVYGGLGHTLACLDSVLADLPDWARVVVVDDASPDPLVVEALRELAGARRITLLAQTVNRGFPGAANIGMRLDAKRDVVLLNSDTLVPPGWLHRLREAAYAAPAIGSATPFSNDATLLSYPAIDLPNAIPDLAETIRLDSLAQRANPGAAALVDLPTAVGFCMYIKRDCLNTTGLLREDLFGQGYGEENDFCIRARHLGWRHVAASGIFVAHVGGQSFGAARQHLITRNLRLLNRVHPGYDALIRDFQHADPMSEPRRRLDIERWKQLRPRQDSVLLVTHGRGGGVQRRVNERAQALRAEGLRPIVIWPVGRRDGQGRDCVLGDGPEGGTPNLRFAVPEELAALVRLLKADRPIRAEIHHLIGHNHAILGLFRRLQIPYEVIIHDYSWFCPRINLVGADQRYCGEPDVAQCEACVADAGTTNDADTPPRALRRQSAEELAGATRIIVPSQDVATRIRRHFPGTEPQAEAWENDADIPPGPPPPAAAGAARIAVIGAIGIEKGYNVLLACARDAAERALPLSFHLVGYSSDDRRLLDTGKVHITGRYEEHEAVTLAVAQRAQLAWLPSIWPETWCFTLTQAWRAGLRVAAFDIGTPAERIRRTGRGWLFPLGLPPGALNTQFMMLAQSPAAVQVNPRAAPGRLATR
ncbi:MAG: glycosyltransferase [Rhodospirillales bacterium]|nr:glycosyltransferase [Rhodospirillales bacterium]